MERPADRSEARHRTDSDLLTRIRTGDLRPYSELYRRHYEPAIRIARRLHPLTDVEDLVSEAFWRVLRVLVRRDGPAVHFRPYLHQTVRRLHSHRTRVDACLIFTDDIGTQLPAARLGEPAGYSAAEGFGDGALERALADLPARWRAVLWLIEVEGYKPSAVGAILGISANAASALAMRAREGLRQAYLRNGCGESGTDAECGWIHQRLAAFVRSDAVRRSGRLGLAQVDRDRVARHLARCDPCSENHHRLLDASRRMPTSRR